MGISLLVAHYRSQVWVVPSPAMERAMGISLLVAHYRSQVWVVPLSRIGAGDGNRTHITSLEGWRSTTELRPHKLPNQLGNFYYIIN